MERYVAGKPRFIVATVGGQLGYAVVRLGGRLNHSDERLTPVYEKLTRQRAERVARRLARQGVSGVSATSTKFHIPLDAKQEEMRARCLQPQTAAEFEEHLTSEQVAKILQVSTDTVFRLFEGKTGVLDLGFPERRSKRIRRLLRIPPSAVRLIQAQFQSKARQ